MRDMASRELLAAASVVSTRWLEGKLTKSEMGRLGRACVIALQAGIPLDKDSAFLQPMAKDQKELDRGQSLPISPGST